MNLHTTLEMQILVAKHAEMQRQMRDLQRKISAELAQRFIEQVEADELVLEELKQLANSNGQTSFSSNLPMPIVISSNDSFSGYR